MKKDKIETQDDVETSTSEVTNTEETLEASAEVNTESKEQTLE
jgi:hypothetical protein